MKFKKSISIIIITLIILAVVFGMGKTIVDNQDVISLKKSRPELIEAVIKVQKEEEKEINVAIQQAKENSVKKILSPLVIVTEEILEVIPTEKPVKK